MVKQKQVNLTYQMIFAIVPYLNLYAFYRVQKLRIFLLISIGISLGVLSVITTIAMMVTYAGGGEDFITEFENLMVFWKSIPIIIISHVGVALINIFLVRRWSKKWNEPF